MPQTSYSDFWGAYAPLINRSPNERNITRKFRRMKFRRALGLALNGAAVGGAALYQEKRVAPSTTEQGQIRPIETRDYVNRVTAAADKTAMDRMLLKNSHIVQTAANANKAGTFPA